MESIKEIDRLFAYLYNKKYEYTKYRDIVDEHFKNDESRVDVQGMLIKLAKDRYVDVGQHTESEKPKIGWYKQAIYKLSFDGRLLFENSPWNKPYKWKKIKGIIKTIWEIAKIIIIVLNACAILYLMYLAVPSSNR